MAPPPLPDALLPLLLMARYDSVWYRVQFLRPPGLSGPGPPASLQKKKKKLKVSETKREIFFFSNVIGS